MILLVRQELSKLYRRYPPYVVYLVILFLVGLIVLGFHSEGGGRQVQRMLQRAGGGMEFVGDPRNGALICEIVLQSMARLLPYLALFVTGEILAGEGASGTLRTILVRPRSRWTIWWAKFITVWLYTLSLSVVMYVASFGLGTLVFGSGQLAEWTALDNQQLLILSSSEAMRYLALSYLLLAVAVMVTTTLAFALGSFFDSGLAPGATALGIVIAMQITAVLPFDWVETIRPYLFTSFLGDFSKAMPSSFDPVTMDLVLPVSELWHSVGGCAAYTASFGIIGLWRFLRRDVTC